MLTDQTRWSLGRGKPLVPSRWQATEGDSFMRPHTENCALEPRQPVAPAPRGSRCAGLPNDDTTGRLPASELLLRKLAHVGRRT